MRLTALILVVAWGSLATAQTKEVDEALKLRLATLKYVQSLHDADSGAFRVQAGGPPSLRAINGAARVYQYLHAADYGMPFPSLEKAQAFLLKCYDAKTGGFAEPGGQPDVVITSVGIMAAVELKIPKEQFRQAMSYLQQNAKSFEEVRIAAAAVEAWGVADCPFDLKPWHAIAEEYRNQQQHDLKDGGARAIGSYVAFKLRLGKMLANLKQEVRDLQAGQRADGGWGKPGAKTSDLETTYRVMRALYLAKAWPTNPEGLQNFLKSCRNADGGYGVQPGTPSSLSGVYYFAIMQYWQR